MGLFPAEIKQYFNLDLFLRTVLCWGKIHFVLNKLVSREKCEDKFSLFAVSVGFVSFFFG